MTASAIATRAIDAATTGAAAPHRRPRYGVKVGLGMEDAFTQRQGVATATEGWILVRGDGVPVVLGARSTPSSTGGTPAVLTMTTTFRDLGGEVPISFRSMPAAAP